MHHDHVYIKHWTHVPPPYVWLQFSICWRTAWPQWIPRQTEKPSQFQVAGKQNIIMDDKQQSTFCFKSNRLFDFYPNGRLKEWKLISNGDFYHGRLFEREEVKRSWAIIRVFTVTQLLNNRSASVLITTAIIATIIKQRWSNKWV